MRRWCARSPPTARCVAEPPAALRLTFNEPVTPLVIRLIAPDGTTTTPAATAENTTVTVKPATLRRGTHVLSWRVISADGHPVGGSLVFSVGEASATPVAGALPAGDPVVRTALWAAKVAIYLALLAGIGGAFVRMWMSGGRSVPQLPPWLDRALVGPDRRRAAGDAAVGRAAGSRCARSAARRRWRKSSSGRPASRPATD